MPQQSCTVADLLQRSLPPRTALELAAMLAEHDPVSDLSTLMVNVEGKLEGGVVTPMRPTEWSGELGVVLIGVVRGRQVMGRTPTSRIDVARDGAWELEQQGRISPRISAVVSAAVRMPEDTRALPRDLAGALREIAEHASGPTLQAYMGLENPDDAATDGFAPITWDDQAGPADHVLVRPGPQRSLVWPVAVGVAILLLLALVVIVKSTIG